jgi:hypothetical protein
MKLKHQKQKSNTCRPGPSNPPGIPYKPCTHPSLRHLGAEDEHEHKNLGPHL